MNRIEHKDESIIVTGAAGFIGSNIIKGLNALGYHNIVAVDNLLNGEQCKNLADLVVADYVDQDDFIEKLHLGRYWPVKAIFHQGACSDTMEQNGKFMMANNYRYSCDLLEVCQQQKIPLIYASSASVYGGGEVFVEDVANEKPLNVYGYSKFLFDQVVRRKMLVKLTAPVVGFRYFNVYGPREQHKGRMASVAYHQFHQFKQEGRVKLFGANDGYAAGEQKRDFIYIDDIVAANLYALEHPTVSGIFNLGTGRAEPFNNIAVAVINGMRQQKCEPALTLKDCVAQSLIEYVPFPDALKGKYQSFTQADMTQWRSIGYQHAFHSVSDGVSKYIHYLLSTTT
jgi:ADP-L-glycero-D-manno-heptose 6-epimerase